MICTPKSSVSDFSTLCLFNFNAIMCIKRTYLWLTYFYTKTNNLFTSLSVMFVLWLWIINFGILETTKISKQLETIKDTISVINNLKCISNVFHNCLYTIYIFFFFNLRDTRVKVVFPFPKSGLLCKEIITLRLLPHVIKGHTFSYRPSSHLKDLIQQTWNNHYYHHLKRSIDYNFKYETNQIIVWEFDKSHII